MSEPMQFEPIRVEPPLAVRIAQQILAAIRAGRFPLGEKLPGEVELSRHFGVSRPTIREALGALQFAGYIDSVRGSAKRVIAQHPEPTYTTGKDLGVVEVLDLLQARYLTEPSVASLAAQNPAPAALAAAETLIYGMTLAVNEPSIEAITDIRVHAAIAKVCRNPFMVDTTLRLLDLAGAPILREARQRAWSDRHLVTEWADHHTDVWRAIKARNPEAAAEASRVHLRSSITNILTALKGMYPPEIKAIADFESKIIL